MDPIAEIASAFVTIAPSAKGFGSSLTKQVSSETRTAGQAVGKTFGKMFALGAGLISAAAVGNLLKGSIDEAREAQKVGAQTGAVLKSTGGIANVTAGQIGKLASALSAKIGVDDEAIQAGENMLLTFTNVRNEVGRGNDIFNQATRTVQDMAAAFGGDAVSNSKILGKALNDPIKGVSALTRVGVSFTEAQKEQIKTLVESGDVMGAQKVILRELGKQTEGSAEAQVTASDKASVALGNLKETIGTALLPVVDRMATVFTETVAPAVTSFVTGMQDGTGAGGQFRNVIQTIGSTIKGVIGFFNGLPGPVKSFGAEAALAALVVPRLTGAVTLLGNSMAAASLKSLALKRGLLLAAGVGGMVAITEGAKTGNKQVGLLGSALTGAFVGGTLGSAIPGVGTAIGAVGGAAVGAGIGMFRLQRASDAAGESAKNAKPDFDSLAASLNQTTGAATRATKSMILQKLQQDGVVSSAGQLGIATSDLIKASLGNRKAIDRVNDAWAKNGNLLDGLTNQKVNDWLLTMRTGLSKSRKEIQESNAAIDGTDRAVRKANPALASLGKQRPNTDKWAALYAGDLARATEKTSAFSTKTQRLMFAATTKTNNLSAAIRRIPNKTVTITVKTNHIGGVTSSAGGHSSEPETPRTAERFGKTVMEGYAKGLNKGFPQVNDTLEKVSKKVKEKISKIRDALSSAKSEFASLVEPVAANFTQGLFDFDTAGAFTANLATVKGTLTTMIANFKKLIGEGLNPGFLYKLFQEGGPALINSLAGLPQSEALAAGSLFGDVMSLSDQLGTAVAGSTDKGAALENQTARLEKKLDKLINHVDKAADRTGQVVNGAASSGRRRARGNGGRRAA